MKLTVKLFARARDLAGQGEVTLEFTAPPDVKTLRTRLGQDHPALQPLLPHLFIAVNEEYARDEDPIPPNATLACFPPVSGG